MTSSARLRELSRVFVTGLWGGRARETLRHRRAAHLEAADFPWIFHGLEREPGGEHNWIMPAVRIFQEPSVQYLTGLNQTGVTVGFDPRHRNPARRVVLFLPWKDPAREFWDGVRLGLLPPQDPASKATLEELRDLLGIETILPADELPAWIDGLARRSRRIGVFHHRYPGGRSLKDDHNAAFARSTATLARRHGATVESIAPQHYHLRLPLDAWQIAECERAQDWTREAFVDLLPSLPELATEHAVAGVLEGGMLRRSPWGLAFPTICAGGANACTLHYLKNDEPVGRDDMVLLDFGCRSASMHADISRTVPRSGRYDPLQRALVEIVIETMERNQSRVRPGATIRELNRAAWEDLETLLEERILSRGGSALRPYAEGRLATLPSGAKAHPFQPHGVSHLMGEQEHDGDPFRLYQDEPLRPGMMLSNEPGIYGLFTLKEGRRRLRGRIGVRVEDDLLVTSGGCRNLSESIPKRPDEIERLVAARPPK